MTTFTVCSEEQGSRLDALLAARFPSSSRAFCRDALLRGAVCVNGTVCVNKGNKVRSGDTVAVESLLETRDNRAAPDPSVPLCILFQDDALIAVNKQAGIAVQPLTCREKGTLMNGLVARFPELAGVGDQPLMAGALHRIDRETSGLVLAARTEAVFEDMRRQFAARSVVKGYTALVEGHVGVPGTLRHALAHDPGVPFCRMMDAAARKDPDLRMEAETVFTPVEWIGAWTLLDVTIRTGVTHQIRCQLALNGTPIVGDTLYGARERYDTERHFLHASSVMFRHPETGQNCRIEAPLTPDFERFLSEARKQ